MPGENVNLEIDQGATFRLALTVKTPDDPAQGITGTPLDLSTAGGARMQIRETVDSPEIVCELNTENGRIVLQPLDKQGHPQIGVIELLLRPARTARIPVPPSRVMPPRHTYVYDLVVIWAPDDVQRILWGSVTVFAGVTR